MEKEGDFVKWFFELDKNSGPIAGGKGANLAEIYNLKMPVPAGFVVTAQAYNYFIKSAGLNAKIKEIIQSIDLENTTQLEESAKEIRELIENSRMPKEMQDDIIEAYENLNADDTKTKESAASEIINEKSEPVFVAVRSSATTEDLAEASFAGQQESFVNIRGNEELIHTIKKCFASLFTARAVYYRNKKGFNETASLAVVIQKMIDSYKSGVIFSKDPIKKENIIIESVFGLGEGIVLGQINPDKYTVSRDLEILEKKISNKKIAITGDENGKTETVTLKENISKMQVLTDYEIKKLADYALKLEEHYQKPQDIEFAIENDKIYIVQTRPITTLNKKIEKETQTVGEELVSGMPASEGIASGKVKIVESMEDLKKIETGDVLVTKMTNPDMVVSMQKSSAIVTDEGGMTAHAAIVSREMGIPCIVGTDNATEKLKDGEIVTVNGFTGKVYKGKVGETTIKEVLPVVKTRTKIKVMVDLPAFAERAAKSEIREVGLTRIEGIISESGKHPNYFLKQNNMKDYEEIIFNGIKDIAEYFDELWIRTSDIRSDEFMNLEGASTEKEANPMLGDHGIRYEIKNPEILKAELNAMKRVSEKGKTIGVLIPQVISVEEVQKVKKMVKEINFKAKVGVMVETPAAVQIIKNLCEEGIDFISFGTNDLTQYTLAIDRGNDEVQDIYNEMHPAILSQIKSVIITCKEYNVETSICGQAGSEKDMVKFLVENGIDSISVNADSAKEISEYVAELEQQDQGLANPIREKGEETEEVVEAEKESTETKEEEPEEIEEEGNPGINLENEKKPGEENDSDEQYIMKIF